VPTTIELDDATNPFMRGGLGGGGTGRAAERRRIIFLKPAPALSFPGFRPDCLLYEWRTGNRDCDEKLIFRNPDSAVVRRPAYQRRDNRTHRKSATELRYAAGSKDAQRAAILHPPQRSTRNDVISDRHSPFRIGAAMQDDLIVNNPPRGWPQRRPQSSLFLQPVRHPAGYARVKP